MYMLEKAVVLYNTYLKELDDYARIPCEDQAETIANVRELLAKELIRVLPDMYGYMVASQEIAVGLENRMLIKTYGSARKKDITTLVDNIGKNIFIKG